MLKTNTKWVLLTFGGLVLVMLYLQRTPPTQTQPTPTFQPPPEFIFPDTNFTLLIGITLEDAEGNVVEFQSDDEGNWYMTQPEKLPVERTDLVRIYQMISGLQIWTNLVDASGITTMNSVGLAIPSYTITLSISDSSDINIAIGDETITGTGYYILVNRELPQVVQKIYIDSLVDMVENPPLLPEPTSVDVTPADGTPADGTPADGTPADGTPADGTPTDTTPEATEESTSAVTPEPTPEPTPDN